MSADGPTTPASNVSDIGKIRVLTLDHLDGRTKAAKQARALLADIESDLGGERHLSAGQRQIAQRAAVMGALLESMEAAWLAGQGINLSEFLPASNAQRRLLESLGLKRQARRVPDPSLHEYVRKHDAANSE